MLVSNLTLLKYGTLNPYSELPCLSLSKALSASVVHSVSKDVLKSDFSGLPLSKHLTQLKNQVLFGKTAIWQAPQYLLPKNYREYTVTINSGRWKLPGTLTIPNGNGPFPAVVLVHGSGPHDQDETIGPNKPFKDLAGGLANQGVAVLRYNKRSFQYGADSCDNLNSLTIKEETIDDVVSAINALGRRKKIQSDRIFVLGHSLGGYLAPRIATETPVAGLIVMGGNTRPLEDLIMEQIEYFSKQGENTPAKEALVQAVHNAVQQIKDPNLEPDTTINLLGSQMPSSYFLDLRNYNPAKTANALASPVLVLQGKRDYQVTMADFNGWKTGLAPKANTAFKLYPQLNHLLMPGEGPSTPSEYLQPNHVSGEAIQDIADWIQSHNKVSG